MIDMTSEIFSMYNKPFLFCLFLCDNEIVTFSLFDQGLVFMQRVFLGYDELHILHLFPIDLDLSLIHIYSTKKKSGSFRMKSPLEYYIIKLLFKPQFMFLPSCINDEDMLAYAFLSKKVQEFLALSNVWFL